MVRSVRLAVLGTASEYHLTTPSVLQNNTSYKAVSGWNYFYMIKDRRACKAVFVSVNHALNTLLNELYLLVSGNGDEFC